MRTVTICLALVLAATASAQSLQHESLTAAPWSHTSAGNWNNGITDPRSSFGKLDHLVTATSFTYTRAPITLGPGTYIADVRWAKSVNATGTAPITLRVIATGIQTLVTPIVDQNPDTFLHNKALMFTLTAASTPVLFSVLNTDTTITKTNYLFDSFHLGKVVNGRAVLVESLTRRWGHAWGAPHYCKEHRDATAQFGFVERLNPRNSSNCGTGLSNLWFYEWNSGARKFLPGLHSWNLRMKKVINTTGSHDMDIWIRKSTDNGVTWVPTSKVVWKATTHTVGQWVYSPNYSFIVTLPTHLYEFWMSRTTGNFKADYHYDSLEVRRGEYTAIGTSCMNNGQATMSGNIPQLRGPLNIEVGPLGSNTNAVTMILGLSNPNLDLSVVGWSGCYQHASLDFQFGMAVSGGTAKLGIQIPNDNALLGIKWYTQAYQVNGSKVETSNGMLGTISN